MNKARNIYYNILQSIIASEKDPTFPLPTKNIFTLVSYHSIIQESTKANIK